MVAPVIGGFGAGRCYRLNDRIMTPEAGKIIADKYRLERPLASGGMGSVWVATHLDLEMPVAVKFLTEELMDNTTVRSRFKREARAAALLKGPNITQIFDYGLFEEAPYIAMELLEGEDLADHFERHGRLPLERIVEIVEPLCRGLQLAHDAGIVHRDLKPSNIFLAKVGDQEIVKILDFGIAKKTIPDVKLGTATESGVLVGSPRYMSPEQATGEPIDHRSDLWSVCVVIYELLTDVSPFDADNIGKIITLICTKEAPPPSEVAEGLVPGLDEFFQKGFKLDPLERFDDARELAAALGRVARGEPLEAEPPSVDALAETSSFDDDAPVKQVKVVTGRESPTETVRIDDPDAASRRDPGTSPGVGIDSGETRKPGRLPLGWMAAAVVAVGLGAWALGSGSTEEPAPGAGATASAPAMTASAPTPEPTTMQVPEPTSSATATSTTSASSSAPPLPVKPVAAPPDPPTPPPVKPAPVKPGPKPPPPEEDFGLGAKK